MLLSATEDTRSGNCQTKRILRDVFNNTLSFEAGCGTCFKHVYHQFFQCLAPVPLKCCEIPLLATNQAGSRGLDALHNLHDVFILQNVVFTHALGAVLAGSAIHKCMLEILHDELVDSVAEVLYCAFASR